MTIYNEVSSNKWKTFLILVIFVIFFGTVSFLIGRQLGNGLGFAGIFLIISGLVSFFSYYYSDKLVLSMSGAKPADKNTHRELFQTVENLSIAAGVTMPRVYVIGDPAPNAFATGRDPKHAAVAVTTGLLEKLKPAELEGVMAHEMSHVRNYDTRLMGVVSILAGSLAILSDVFLRSMWFGGFGGRDDDRRGNNGILAVVALIMAVLAPIAAVLIQLAISRRREFLADASGALLTRYPDGLADALEKIATDRHILKHASNATAHFYIENPFKTDAGSKVSGLANLFSTHPPIEERIKILRAM